MNFFKPKFWDKNQISFFSVLLFPISLLIKFLAYFKNSITKTNDSSIPVICVGNIYLGGTGKTPLCIEIFSILKKLNMNPAFIRKEYDLFQDEKNLQKNIGPVFENKKRIKAVQEAVQNNINVVIFDDGFQDLSVKKNLSIICFNEQQWIGNGLTIPSGPLRSSLSALKNADCVVINGKKNDKIENKLLSENEKIKIFYSIYKPQNISEFKNKKIIAFAGIGNPDNFFNLLKDNKINIVDKIKFPDHYRYSEQTLKSLINKAKKNNTTLLTTEKDYFRINKNLQKNINFLKIKVEIDNQKELVNEIKKII